MKAPSCLLLVGEGFPARWHIGRRHLGPLDPSFGSLYLALLLGVHPGVWGKHVPHASGQVVSSWEPRRPSDHSSGKSISYGGHR